MVFICVFLVLRDAEHFLYSFPYIVQKLIPYQVHGLCVFSQSLGCLCSVLFALQERFSLKNPTCCFYCLWFQSLVLRHRSQISVTELFPSIISATCSFLSTLSSFMNILSQVSFVFNKCLFSFFCVQISNFPNIILIRQTVLSLLDVLGKLGYRYFGLFWSFPFHWSLCLFLCQNHIILIATTVKYTLKSRSMRTPGWGILLKIALDFRSFLVLYKLQTIFYLFGK